MKYVVVICLLLCGCTINVNHSTHLYVICYKEDKYLQTTGEWLSNQVYYKCDRRRQLGFQTKLGTSNHDWITDFKIKDQ